MPPTSCVSSCPGTTGQPRRRRGPTLGIVGRLGGVGARPSRIGLVSDADGAVAAIAVARKLAFMRREGDVLAGDVIIATHICPDAPTKPHLPVDFMDSPVSIEQMNQREVTPEMAAVLSIDTTKGNRLLNTRGFAISPTVKEGWILKVAPDLLRLAEVSSGRAAGDLPDYDAGHHALRQRRGSSEQHPAAGHRHRRAGGRRGHLGRNGRARLRHWRQPRGGHRRGVRFAIEVAKEVGTGLCRFHDQAEFEQLVALYGDMRRLQGTAR